MFWRVILFDKEEKVKIFKRKITFNAHRITIDFGKLNAYFKNANEPYEVKSISNWIVGNLVSLFYIQSTVSTVSNISSILTFVSYSAKTEWANLENCPSSLIFIFVIFNHLQKKDVLIFPYFISKLQKSLSDRSQRSIYETSKRTWIQNQFDRPFLNENFGSNRLPEGTQWNLVVRRIVIIYLRYLILISIKN